MAKQWKCARCSTKNDESTLTCSNCRMIRGAVVVPGSFSSPDPSAAPSSGWPASTEPEPGTEGGPPPTSYWEAGTAPTGEPATRPLWRRIPIGVVLFGLLAVAGGIGGLLFDASRSSTGEITREGDMMAADLRVGDCFDLKDADAEEVTDVTARPCTDEHAYELFFTGAMADGAYPADAAFDAFFDANCVDAFDGYVGKAYAESRLDIYWLIPLDAAWSAGDRTIQCAAYDPDVPRQTGSVRGSNR